LYVQYVCNIGVKVTRLNFMYDAHVAHTHACCSGCCRVLQCVAVHIHTCDITPPLSRIHRRYASHIYSHIHIIRICLCECVRTTWRMCMCDMIEVISYILIRTCILDSCFSANVYVRHDMMNLYVTWLLACRTCVGRLRMRDMTNRHDECVCVIWLLSCRTYTSCVCIRIRTLNMVRISMFDLTIVCATWRNDMANVYVWCNLCQRISHTRRTYTFAH